MVSRKILLTYKLRLFYRHSKSLISDSLKNNTNSQELWQHWPTVLNGTIWLEMSSAGFVYLGCVVGYHTRFRLTLLIYVTSWALKMSEPAPLGCRDLLSAFIPDVPQHLTHLPPALLLSDSVSLLWERRGHSVLCAWGSVCTMGEGCGLSLLCVQVEVRSLREKKRGKGDTKTWEEMIEKGN